VGRASPASRVRLRCIAHIYRHRNDHEYDKRQFIHCERQRQHGFWRAVPLQGNGATTPNKYIRAFNGAFQIVNSANSATPMSMDDAGNMTLTGALTATGIAGNTTGTAASAGTLGEVPSATFSSVSMTTTTVQNLTSMNLTAGVYLVWGSATYQVGTGATMNIWLAGVSQTTGALPALGSYFQSSGTITATGGYRTTFHW
jgi:hypothetical protein